MNLATYRSAADRIRRGRPIEMDAICDAFEVERNAIVPQVTVRSIYDLPIAKRMWEQDAHDVER